VHSTTAPDTTTGKLHDSYCDSASTPSRIRFVSSWIPGRSPLALSPGARQKVRYVSAKGTQILCPEVFNEQYSRLLLSLASRKIIVSWSSEVRGASVAECAHRPRIFIVLSMLGDLPFYITTTVLYGQKPAPPRKNQGNLSPGIRSLSQGDRYISSLCSKAYLSSALLPCSPSFWQITVRRFSTVR
jgi:hypothetical protein